MRFETLPALLSAIAACAKMLGDDDTLRRANEMHASLTMGGLFDGPFGSSGNPFGQ